MNELSTVNYSPNLYTQFIIWFIAWEEVQN